MEVKLSFNEVQELMGVPSPEFPKYTTQLLNLANQTAGGTKPRVVGKMTEMVPAFPGSNLQDWANWYLENHQDKIDIAIARIQAMIGNYREAIKLIDENMIREWVVDLILVKTFIGIKFQEAILKKISELAEKPFRYASSDEESKGIDGFIGNTPISIKPISYRAEKHLPEFINVVMVFYEKEEKKGIKISIPGLDVFR